MEKAGPEFGDLRLRYEIETWILRPEKRQA
jgi:hypothetical protein